MPDDLYELECEAAEGRCAECGGNDESPVGHCTDCPVVHAFLWDLHLCVCGTKPSMKEAIAISHSINELVHPVARKKGGV